METDFFYLEHRENSNMQAVGDDYQIETLLRNKHSHSTWVIVERLQETHMIVVKHFKILGYVSSYDVWMPQGLTEQQFNETHFHLRFSVQTRQKKTCF